MTTEFNELLPIAHGDKAQVWIVGTRDQVIHLVNEFYVKKIAIAPFYADYSSTVYQRQVYDCWYDRQSL